MRESRRGLCPFYWSEQDRPVACIRVLGHDGRHIARHPTELGEHVFHEAEPEDDRVPSAWAEEGDGA